MCRTYNGKLVQAILNFHLYQHSKCLRDVKYINSKPVNFAPSLGLFLFTEVNHVVTYCACICFVIPEGSTAVCARDSRLAHHWLDLQLRRPHRPYSILLVEETLVGGQLTPTPCVPATLWCFSQTPYTFEGQRSVKVNLQGQRVGGWSSEISLGSGSAIHSAHFVQPMSHVYGLVYYGVQFVYMIMCTYLKTTVFMEASFQWDRVASTRLFDLKDVKSSGFLLYSKLFWYKVYMEDV